MHIGAIICEYNPFHNGHFHQIQTLKSFGCDGIIVLMSGNFVQRGEPSLFNKFTRAQAALFGGANLVLELPLPYSLSSAEGFGFGAVKILEQLGCVNTLCFGAECTDLSELWQIAGMLYQKTTISQIKQLQKMGMSYPSAISKLVTDVLGEEKAQILSESNNILAVEYLKALLQLNSTITPYPIERKGVSHNGTSNGSFASATHLRALIQSNNLSWQQFVPSTVLPLYHNALQKGLFINSFKFDFMCLSYLKRLNTKDFVKIADVSGGFENKIVSQVLKATSLHQLVESLVDKTHTKANIKRMLINAFLQIPKESKPNFTRVLGFNKVGEEILNRMKTTASIPFSNRLLNCVDENYVNLLDQSTNLYNLALEKPKASKEEFTTAVIKL